MANGTGLRDRFAYPRLAPRQRQKFSRMRRRNPDAARDYRNNALSTMARKPQQGGYGNLFRGQGYKKLDPTLRQAGDAQWGANVGANDTNARYNRPNISSSYGNVNVTQDPRTGEWTINQNVNAEQQGVLSGAWQGTTNRLNQVANQGAYNPDTEANRARVEQSVMDRFNRLNASQFKQQEDTFRQRMADQGIQPGSADWNTRYQQEVVQPQTLARQEAMSGAVNQGLGEQQQQFNQGIMSRQLPFQEMQNLMALTGQVQQPNAIYGQTNMAPVDIMGPQSNYGLANIQGQTSRDVANISGGYQVQAAGIAAEAAKYGADAANSGGNENPYQDPNQEVKSMNWNGGQGGYYPQQNQGWMQGPPGWRWNGQTWIQG